MQTKAQQKFPTPVDGDYILSNFEFETKEKLPQLNIHYASIGKPHQNKNGVVDNAVLIMHGTTGSGQQFLSDLFAGNLFVSGGLLDANKYFIILPDGIGHGKSSKPSNGLLMAFPKYTYTDMVKADYLLLTQHLGISHLRLVMGTSMGGMHTWQWGYTYPDFMDALMPLASLPVEIAGRNRMLRKMAINLIEMDPAWQGGAYLQQPKLGLAGAISSLVFMVSAPLQWQAKAPTRAMADSMLASMDASRNYDPSPHLQKITAPLFAINSADDQVNPPELKVMDREIKKVKNGRYILLPITEKTSGHGTHSNPTIWGDYLKQLLALSAE